MPRASRRKAFCALSGSVRIIEVFFKGVRQISHRPDQRPPVVQAEGPERQSGRLLRGLLRANGCRLDWTREVGALKICAPEEGQRKIGITQILFDQVGILQVWHNVGILLAPFIPFASALFQDREMFCVSQFNASVPIANIDAGRDESVVLFVRLPQSRV
jgi:hypothetical protein